MLKKNQFHLVPRKYHHLLEDVQEFAGVVEVLLKPGIEYAMSARLLLAMSAASSAVPMALPVRR